MGRDLEFFKNVFQVEGKFGDEPGKLPIFYFDGTIITGFFLARKSALKKMMPKSSYYPVSVAPGVGVIAITCFEYRDTDIKPYNEISVAIPITYGAPSLIPAASLIAGMKKNQYSGYIRHLPVTTKVALRGGVDVYNYPKFLSGIEFEDRGGETVVTLSENGETIFTTYSKNIPATGQGTFRYITYPVKDDCAQQADALVNAKKFGQSMAPGGMRIELGENHAIAEELRGALIGRKSIMNQYAPEFQSILYAPVRLE